MLLGGEDGGAGEEAIIFFQPITRKAQLFPPFLEAEPGNSLFCCSSMRSLHTAPVCDRACIFQDHGEETWGEWKVGSHTNPERSGVCRICTKYNPNVVLDTDVQARAGMCWWYCRHGAHQRLFTLLSGHKCLASDVPFCPAPGSVP